jgi:hypothetical protein
MKDTVCVIDNSTKNHLFFSLQLLAIAEFWYADDTFASSPKGWKQFFN